MNSPISTRAPRPSVRVISRSEATATKSRLAPIRRGMSSRRAMRSTVTGRIRAVRPRIRARLATLDPSTLPTARPGWPFKAASTEANSSGAEVPMLTTVRPTMSGGMLAFRARAAALRTSSSPPPTRNTRPKTSASRAGMSGGTPFRRRAWRQQCPALGMSLSPSGGTPSAGCLRGVRAVPVEERGYPTGPSSRPQSFWWRRRRDREGGRALAQVIRSAEDLALDVLLGVADLPHEFAHGLRHGGQSFVPKRSR